MRRFLIVVALVAGLAVAPTGIVAGASAPATETCHTVKTAKTKIEHVKVKVKVKGKTETKTETKRVDVRHNVKVREAYKVRVKGKTVTKYKTVVKSEIEYTSTKVCTQLASAVAPTPTSTVSPTTTPTTTSTPVVSLSASLDPTYTQSSTNPLAVTWSFSASASETTDGVTENDPSLPDGVLEFFSNGSLVNSSDVGGSVTGATSTITYPSYGDETVDVIYDSGTSSATTGNETYDIENPTPGPLATTTTLSIGSLGSNGYPFTADITDANGVVTPAVQGLSFSINWECSINGCFDTMISTETTGQTTCTIEVTETIDSPTETSVAVTSSNCSVANGYGNIETGIYITPEVVATFLATSVDAESSSSEVTYP